MKSHAGTIGSGDEDESGENIFLSYRQQAMIFHSSNPSAVSEKDTKIPKGWHFPRF
jgi:hypothetical protein